MKLGLVPRLRLDDENGDLTMKLFDHEIVTMKLET